MNCQGVRLSSGLRRPEVGALNAGLIFSFGSKGCRSGIFKIVMIAPNAARGTRIDGISRGAASRTPSTRIIDCAIKMAI